jgi:hypothetical protein
MGPNERIYIGKIGGSFKQLSVIDYPDNKGMGCGFCRKCFRLPDSTFTAATAPPNMPDYTLGADLSKPCWPLSYEQLVMPSEPFEVYPNPSSTTLNIKTENKGKREMYNSVGQLLFVTEENEINIGRYSRGIYYIKIGNMVRKVIIE